MSAPAHPDTSIKPNRKLLKALAGEAVWPPPIWLMRQAGRYLPEYREVRATAGGFLNLCYNPALATEVTLQPIRRYGFDAAILFSDILVVPDALGQQVRFLEGEGPCLDPITDDAGLGQLNPAATGEKFGRVYETVARLRQDLPAEVALIGFCGAPWTVATYMVGGRGSSDQAAARMFAYRDREAFTRLIDIVVETSIEYLDGQVKAGADALQIFDSWAGNLPDGEFQAWVVAPTVRIVSELKRRHPDVPIIGFPRGAGLNAEDYVLATKVDGLGCDTAMPLGQMRALAEFAGVTVQGNLDPLLLVSGGQALEDRIAETLEALRDVPAIFNLGHGIVPQTPPEHVARLVELVRGGT
ncbi:uroporphyrinogen decarboxylase [Hyphomicrobium sulfonivorans]|uniref:uroporphyrinogen decarboxylase n=1 Tax=Hyphomicrobium sulfonivorans TaxID=121290 RepID=UPI0015705FB0|nr:uroporphyrinogen decarboxylase [Hyphomicrobium sulfonivorans]MBI1648482.1 uroporphyrinogen decarboxylase [Hyphomicrobium sulfonivorans]NSL70980.1 uroporphyrinogen decarboxylase [Hyphomicrobium sulfonivorans]